MRLLNSRDNRLALFMANFAGTGRKPSAQQRASKKAYEQAIKAQQTPIASPLSTVDETRRQIQQVLEAGKAVQEGTASPEQVQLANANIQGFLTEQRRSGSSSQLATKATDARKVEQAVPRTDGTPILITVDDTTVEGRRVQELARRQAYAKKKQEILQADTRTYMGSGGLKGKAAKDADLSALEAQNSSSLQLSPREQRQLDDLNATLPARTSKKNKAIAVDNILIPGANSEAPVPTYAIQNPDGTIDATKIQRKPKRGNGLERRAATYEGLQAKIAEIASRKQPPQGTIYDITGTRRPITAQSLLEELKSKTSNVLDAVQTNVRERNQDVKTGITNRQAAQSAAQSTASSTPQSSSSSASVSNAGAAPPVKKPRNSNTIKASAKTPKGQYSAELELPEVLLRGRQTGTRAATTPKSIEISNPIINRQGIIDRVKQSYKGLGKDKRSLLLGGGLLAGGGALLAGSSLQAAKDRRDAEARTRELDAVSRRPPSNPLSYGVDLNNMQPSPPNYNPYQTYQPY